MYERQPEYEATERPMDLRPLGDMKEWHLEDEKMDIRGWDVVDRDDNDVGKVDELLVSTETEEIVFAVVSYGGTLGVGAKKTLVPIELLDFDYDNKQAVYIGSADNITNAPDYRDDTRDFGMFYDYWSGRGRGRMETGRERVIPEVEEHLEVGKREEQVGEVRVHKEVETRPETVREPVTRTRVHVFRRRVEPGREMRPGEGALREGEEVRIPIVEEKLVVEKRPEVTGEVVVRPEEVEEEEQIRREVRKEHVVVEKKGEAEVEEED
ncbi:MAG: YsnF/AvaK domain-containing protein [Armatimonadota bacterium]